MDAGAKRKTYKIGQAAKLLDVKPFVLRFWEGEFKGLLVPVRTPSGQRAYTEANVELVREIKRLLYDEGLTIEGAKKRLREAASQGPRPAAAEPAPAQPASAAPVGPGGTAAVVASAPATSAAAPWRPAQPSLLDAPSVRAVRPEADSWAGQSPPAAQLPAASRLPAPGAPAADPHALRRAEDKAQALHAALADVLTELRSLRELLG